MGKKLDAVDERLMVAFNESVAKLKAPNHATDQYDNGYAQALYDVKQIIEALR